MRRRQIFLAVSLLLVPFSASAAERHWLLGTWEGERKNVSQRNQTIELHKH